MKNSFTYDRAWTIYKKYILPAYFIFLAVFLIAAAAKFNEADGGEQATLQNTACSGKRILASHICPSVQFFSSPASYRQLYPYRFTQI